jgi:uncharacterized membrane protein YoaT (DUF817 family)
MIVIVFGVIALALYITSFVMSGQYMDQTADWNIIKKELRKIWIITVVASITLFISISMLYQEVQARDRFMYLLLLMICMSLGFSVCSLSISAMVKV